METSKLIILRGPSGSGKSTVAKELFKLTRRKTVLIEQDHYRFIFKPAGLPQAGKEIIFSDTLIALKYGYDVILEGLLTIPAYGEYFESLFSHHPAKNYMFYFDISFAETLRRHATKPVATEFGEKEMREWYKLKDFSNYDFEQIITEQNSADQTLATIRKTTLI